MTGFGVTRQDLEAVGRSCAAAVGPIEGKSDEIGGTRVSGANVGAPYHYEGEHYRSLFEDMSRSVHAYALRFAGIANALGTSANTYDSMESDNSDRFDPAKFGR